MEISMINSVSHNAQLLFAFLHEMQSKYLSFWAILFMFSQFKMEHLLFVIDRKCQYTRCCVCVCARARHYAIPCKTIETITTANHIVCSPCVPATTNDNIFVKLFKTTLRARFLVSLFIAIFFFFILPKLYISPRSVCVIM